ncbi:unnamed protein product [Oncorhynchus mykiss]|uniref:Caskin C-terminal domain-containing protein n=1 Tax=Oncorhynchus mykiss TaxID=8022 RepID=A0A060XBD5_ONCMY|nr:unnamed protein product [Oncorhynchus mykiss]
MSRSQESIDARSRGSGRSQDPPTASITPHSRSQESLGGSSWDQRSILQQQLPKQVPLGAATVFQYPAIPAKPKGPGTDVGHGSPTKPLAHTYHAMTLAPPKKRSQSLTRYALSDGEPDEEDDDLAPPSSTLESYATLTRRPGRSQLAGMQTTPVKYGTVGRSQSFAVRARKKGPPPAPPKRLSSVSSSPSVGSTENMAPSPGGVETDSPGSASAGMRRRVQSECAPAQTDIPDHYPDPERGVKSDSEEEEPKAPGLDGSSSPHNSSSECIPFAEEGNLTIKQRPKVEAAQGREHCGDPGRQERATKTALEVPEFNLKESDTVKRRYKPKDHAGSSPTSDSEGQIGSDSSPGSRPQSQSSVTGTPLKPPVSPKPHSSPGPPVTAPKPSRHSLAAATVSAFSSCLTAIVPPTMTVNVVQSLAFSAPPSPTPSRCPPAPGLQCQAAQTGKPQVCVVGPGPGIESGPGLEVVQQQRLEQTSTSLEAALQAVERKLTQEDSTDGGANTVKSAGNILDDIGNMFDDLADQLDAMLD